jgi:3-phosphoshikimate 1-carboxyvinyltransferase
MKVLISKSSISGSIAAPPSKSYTLRALLCAALAGGRSTIFSPLLSDDTLAAMNVLAAIGVGIESSRNSLEVRGGDLHGYNGELFCGESAGTLRFMMAVCSLIPGNHLLTAGPSLMKRPVSALISALEQIGVSCRSNDGYAPLTIRGGNIKGGLVKLPGDISSQFLSALLFIGPLLETGLEIRLTTPLESESYVRMTMACMKEFGIRTDCSHDFRSLLITRQSYQPVDFTVEGDWSSISYFLALGALAGKIKVGRLNTNSLQGDSIITSLLQDMGANVDIGPDFIEVNKSPLNRIEADLHDCIDLLPTMAVLAAAATGESTFSGIARARIKESDRIASVRQGLLAMGIPTHENEDLLIVKGSVVHGAAIDPQNDHRIAMAFSIPGAVAGDTVIQTAECVNKTYPEYWQVFRKVGGKVRFEQ